ncbi:MAG TPA: DHA2 family efflux MFS transporter permease subunit [Alphaproteobacteria bacterium]|nr:DHA2 family efflux MFS transporter permease subunit [Alphaproteobacteria bacterium]
MSFTAGSFTAGRSDRLNRGLVTVSIMLATIMQALDTTIANVALPHMQGSMSATQDQISWVLTSYIVAAAIMTPPTGFLAARLGRKRLFLLAVGGFTVASMLCGAATSLDELVLFRLLQGVFGAGLVPLSQSVLLDTYPPEKHGSAMAMWGVGVMVGPILGPTLGGYLTEFYNWRWVFYINLPFGMLALAGIALFVSETERDRERPFDWFGFTMLSLAIGALQLMLDRGESQDWFSSTEIIIEAVVAGLCFYMFVAHMLTARRPFLEPGLFRDRNLVTGLFFIFIVGIILLATLALLPPFLQQLMGYPVITTGFVLAPRGVGTMIAMVLVGRLITRVNVRLLILLGLSLTSLSLWEMAGFTLEVSEWDLIRTGITQGLGLGFIFVPLSTVTFATLAPHLRTEGTALFSLMRNIGSSIGISVVVTLLARNTQTNHAILSQHATPLNPVFQWLDVSRIWDLSSSHGLSALNAEVTRQAATIAYLDDFRLMMVVTLLAVPMLLLLRTPKRSAGPAVEVTPE